MPSSSAKQHRFMAAVAHSPSFAKKAGVSQSVGKDFNAADKGKTFNKGGMMKMRKMKTRRFYEGGMDDRDDDPEAQKVYSNVGRGSALGSDDTGNSYYEVTPEQRATPRAARAAARLAARPATSMVADAPKGDIENAAYRRMRTLEKTLNRLTREDSWNPENKAAIEAAKEKYKYTPEGFTESVERARAQRVEELQRIIDRGSKKSTAKMKQGGTVKESKGMTAKGGMPMKDGKPAFMKRFAKGGGIESRGKTKGTMIRMASGGSVSSASRRADGIAQRGKTRC